MNRIGLSLVSFENFLNLYPLKKDLNVQLYVLYVHYILMRALHYSLAGMMHFPKRNLRSQYVHSCRARGYI